MENYTKEQVEKLLMQMARIHNDNEVTKKDITEWLEFRDKEFKKASQSEPVAVKEEEIRKEFEDWYWDNMSRKIGVKSWSELIFDEFIFPKLKAHTSQFKSSETEVHNKAIDEAVEETIQECKDNINDEYTYDWDIWSKRLKEKLKK